jgi:hypothetical protein
MTLLDTRQEKFTTKIYADNVNQMLEIITFDFYKYGDRFKNNKGNLRRYLRQFDVNGRIELEMVHQMFIVNK